MYIFLFVQPVSGYYFLLCLLPGTILMFHSSPGLTLRLKQRYKNISARSIIAMLSAATLLNAHNALLVTWLVPPAVKMSETLHCDRASRACKL